MSKKYLLLIHNTNFSGCAWVWNVRPVDKAYIKYIVLTGVHYTPKNTPEKPEKA